MGTVYFARWILLEDNEILENGALAVSGNLITSVGPRSKAKRGADDRVVNLGETLLMPGLINMHTHLEESVIRGATTGMNETFASFSAKRASRLRQFPDTSIEAHVRLTVRELLTNGITTVVDSSRLGLSRDVLNDESIRSWVIREIHPDQEEQVLQEIHGNAANGPDSSGSGIGPYAIYSVSPETHRSMSNLTSNNNLLWASHVAESAEELQAFSEQSGDLFFQITWKKPWPFGDTRMGSMQYALTSNLIPERGICFHCNYCSGQELSLLAERNVSIVVCFQYSRMIGHKEFPLDVALNRGVRICLGTEGIVAAGFMDLFDELYALKQTYPHIAAREMINWVTRNPAYALKQADTLGSLSAGKFADFIGVQFPFDPGKDLLEELLVEEPDVVLVVVNGEELITSA